VKTVVLSRMTHCEECGGRHMTAGVKVMHPLLRGWPTAFVDGVKCCDCGRAYPADGAIESARTVREAVTIPAPPQ